MRHLARWLLDAQDTVLGWLAFLPCLLVRVMLGWAMWQDGAGKLNNLDKVAKFFGSLYLPFTNIPLPHPEMQAHAIAALEYYGGFLLLIGLFTRPVALMLAGAMVGAILMSDSSEFISKWLDASPTDATSFTDFALAMVIGFLGAGPLSVDGLFAVFYREWALKKPSIRMRLGEIVTCWVVRGLVCLVLLAITPISGPSPTADTLVMTGVRTTLVRPGRDSDADGDNPPPATVTEYPPNVVNLAVAALLLMVVGGGLYLMFRPRPLVTTGRKKKIVILGAGFGGLYTALELDRILGSDPWVEVTLVNKENFHLFTPMLHEVAASDVEITHIVNPIRKLLKHTCFFEGTVESVDLAGHRITVSHGVDDPHVHELEYDQLVIALGAVTNFYNMPGIADHSLTMKSLGDAITLRNRLIESLEEADFECTPEAREGLLTFVVCGGGFAGVETVAAVNDFVREALEYYPNLREEMLRVVMVHPGPYLLPELGEKLGHYTGRKLAERHVEVKLETRVKDYQDHCVVLSDGSRIRADLVVWTAGTSPNPLIATLPCKKERGRLLVDPTMEVPDYPGVWGLGDCVYMVDPATNMPYPPTAQHALRQGHLLAHNIEASLRGQPRQPFVFKTLGLLAAIGRRTGVAQIMGVNFSGFIAWWMWRTIYLFKLPSPEKQLRVMFDWTLDLVFSKDLVQFDTFRENVPKRAPLPPDDAPASPADAAAEAAMPPVASTQAPSKP